MKKLQEMRAEKKLTLIEASRAMDIDPSTLSRIERGVYMPQKSTVPKIADFYQVPAGELVAMLYENAVQ